MGKILISALKKFYLAYTLVPPTRPHICSLDTSQKRGHRPRHSNSSHKNWRSFHQTDQMDNL